MAKDLTEFVASRIRALRTLQGLTLETLAERAGMPVETLSRIERRKMAPSLRSLTRVAVGLGVPLVALLTDEAVVSVSAEGIPPEVRGIALRLSGQPARVLDQARRILDVLTEELDLSVEAPR